MSNIFNSPELKALDDAIQGAFGRLSGRMQELEQRLVAGRAPHFGGSGDDSITKALETSEQLKAMQRGELRGGCRIVLPADAISTKTITGPTTPGAGALQDPDRATGIVGAAMRRLTVRALLPSLPTTAGATQYTRQSVFTSGAQIQGEDSSPFEKEGAIKGETGMTFELVTSDVVTVATWIPASVQVLNDLPALEQHIRTWLTFALGLEEEDEILNGSGASGHLEGLVTAATAFNRGATGDTRADVLRKAVTQLQLADHVATGFLLNPSDAEGLDLLKDTTGQYLKVMIGDRAWNVPVISTNSIASGSWLAGDFMSAQVRDRQGVTIEISNSHEDFFTRNLLAIRAELREGLEIHRPLGFVTGDFNQGT